jgi:asparagine synthase (glutamine-hydrolysing)
MANEDGTVWTVFNGEIYDHRELRHDLEKRGHVFKGHSDTEVLPHLYEEDGVELVGKLRGMFAIAIYDARSRTLILARDRFGIKPLFYAPGKERLAFASEIRALLELRGIDTTPDRQAIYDFAALFFIPAPETFYRGIRALQPGEMLEARLDADRVSWTTRTYHRWSITPDPALTLEKATDRVDALLTNAVRCQMESDVPLGTLLSGGIDSSLVSAAAQEALNGGLRTQCASLIMAMMKLGRLGRAKHIGSCQRYWKSRINRNLGTCYGAFIGGQPRTHRLSPSMPVLTDAPARNRRAVWRWGDEAFEVGDVYWQIARIALALLPDFWRQGLDSETLGKVRDCARTVAQRGC